MQNNFEPLPSSYKRKRQRKKQPNNPNNLSKKAPKKNKKKVKNKKSVAVQKRAEIKQSTPKKKREKSKTKIKRKDLKKKRLRDNKNLKSSQKAKKVRKTKKKRKKLIKFSPKAIKIQKNVLYITVISALLIGFIVILISFILRIETINIDGQAPYDTNEITSALDAYKGSNILFCEDKSIIDTLGEKLPYVEVVSIQKDLPETLNITVAPTTVTAMVKDGNDYVYLNDEYRIIERNTSKLKSATLLKGIELNKEKSGLYAVFSDKNLENIFKEILTYSQECGIDKITEIDLTDQLNCLMTYDNRIKIKLGLSTDLQYKIKMARGVLDSGSITDSTKGTIDASLASTNNRTYFRRKY